MLIELYYLCRQVSKKGRQDEAAFDLSSTDIIANSASFPSSGSVRLWLVYRTHIYEHRIHCWISGFLQHDKSCCFRKLRNPALDQAKRYGLRDSDPPSLDSEGVFRTRDSET
jgi:hypothetical protein